MTDLMATVTQGGTMFLFRPRQLIATEHTKMAPLEMQLQAQLKNSRAACCICCPVDGCNRPGLSKSCVGQEIIDTRVSRMVKNIERFYAECETQAFCERKIPLERGVQSPEGRSVEKIAAQCSYRQWRTRGRIKRNGLQSLGIKLPPSRRIRDIVQIDRHTGNEIRREIRTLSRVRRAVVTLVDRKGISSESFKPVG